MNFFSNNLLKNLSNSAMAPGLFVTAGWWASWWHYPFRMFHIHKSLSFMKSRDLFKLKRLISQKGIDPLWLINWLISQIY